MRRRLPLLRLACAFAPGLAACSGGEGVAPSQTDTATGSATITVQSIGNGSDPDGVTISLVGDAPPTFKTVAVGSSATFGDLPPGSFSVVVSDVSQLCVLQAPQPFQVRSDHTTDVTVDLDCIGGFYFTSYHAQDQRYDLELVDTGGHRKRLTSSGRYTAVDVAPDGSAVSAISWVYRPDNEVDLRGALVHADGSLTGLEWKAGAVHRQPVWSPRGDLVAAGTTGTESGSITLFDAATGAIVGGVTDRTNARTPQWAPDGGRLAFSRIDTVFAYDLGTGETTPVYAHGMGFPELLGWSSDGRYLAARLYQNGQYNVLVIDMDAGSLLATIPIDYATQVAWHPSAPVLVIDVPRDGLPRGLRTVDVETGVVTDLVHAPPGIGTPNWSEDGNRILFRAEGGLYVYDVPSGVTRLILEDPGVTLLSPRWQHGSGPRRGTL